MRALDRILAEPGGRRVLVYSLGREGRDLAEWFVAGGALVTMSDTRSAAQLEAAGATPPSGVERVVTGEALLSPEGFDLVAASQSVLRHDPAIVSARETGVPVVSQMQLFLRLCRGRVAGITGSSGKSTTTALVGAMAATAGVEHIVGGNIGRTLLAEAERLDPTTLVILEISHSQLQYTDRSPGVAAVTNVTPNHLDQFSWDEYVDLKRNILAHQGPEDIAVLNADDPVGAGFAAGAPGAVRWASARSEPKGDGAHLAGEAVVLRRGEARWPVVERSAIRLRGAHNLANVVMACTIGDALGLPLEAMREAISGFEGVPHRLEVVGRTGGVIWVNDSIATAPERTMAALRAYEEPVVLLLGGREKRLPLEGLRELAAERCRAVVCFGEAGPLFHDGLAGAVEERRLVADLEGAVTAASEVACDGDVVLLSPAGTSFDAYPNFEARGEAFRKFVRALPGFEEVRA